MATAAVDTNVDLTLPQAGRLLQVRVASVPEDILALHRFSGDEHISHIFQYKLELLATPKAVKEGKVPPLKDLLGQGITVSLLDGIGEPGAQKKRYFHGIVGRIASKGADARFHYFEVEMVPWLWLLTRKRQSRIFQQKTVIDIVQEVFQGAKSGYVKFEPAIHATYPQLDYCVQYEETDFNFVSRLMERDGISYFFKHERDGHTLVFTDANAKMPENPAQQEAPYFAGGYGDGMGTVTEWKHLGQIQPGKYTLRDQHFRDPGKDLEHTSGDDGDNLEVYDTRGDHAAPFNLPNRELAISQEGERLARVRMEEAAMTGEVFTGSSSWRHFTTGHKFSLVQHPTLSGKYIPALVRHSARQSPDYISSGVKNMSLAYHAEVVCVPVQVPIRPARGAKEPRIYGLLTATVAVKQGEESWLDKFGRVRVRFHWDREGKNDENSACWVRVSQPWADGSWGAHFWPREGQEVVVQFVEGDLDRPIVTGSLYNAANMPPYELPQHYTRSGIKSRSSKQGGSNDFNELRLEDKRGAEQVFLHAQKDMDQYIKNDHRVFVGANQHLLVAGLQNELTQGDRSSEVSGSRMEKVGAKLSVQVGDAQHQTVGSVYTLEAGSEIHLKSGSKIVIEGGMEISLKGPGGFVHIGSSGVTIQGTLVTINNGGSASSGTASSPGAPKAPDKADDGKFGTKQA